MKRTQKLLGLLSALLVLISVPAIAGDGPIIPKAMKGKQCVEETSDMRRNHMDYLRTHRVATLRDGIRTKQYSLKACLDCHVAPEGTKAAAEEEGHFCKNCHSYAGVSFDCFECHATRPEMSAGNNPHLPETLKALKGIHNNSSALLNQMASNKNRTGDIQ